MDSCLVVDMVVAVVLMGYFQGFWFWKTRIWFRFTFRPKWS